MSKFIVEVKDNGTAIFRPREVIRKTYVAEYKLLADRIYFRCGVSSAELEEIVNHIHTIKKYSMAD